MILFTFQKDAPTRHDCLKFSAVCKPIGNPFTGFVGLCPTSSGRCSHAASQTSSGPSVYSAFPRLASSPQLITQHSPPIPPCMFDALLPPTSLWIFSISSLPTARSASDWRCLDAMDRSHPRSVCPAIDAAHYCSCRAVRTSFGASAAATTATSCGPSFAGAHRSRFGAHEDRVSLWNVDVGQLMGRSSRNRWNRTAPGRPSG
jgi:hypothetical protein